MASDEVHTRVPGVDRGVAVLGAIAAAGVPVGLAGLTRTLGLPRSSLHAVCAALVAERLLSRGVDGSYRLGPALLELAAARRARQLHLSAVGITVPNSTNDFYDAEIAAVTAEATLTGATVVARSAGQNLAQQRADIAELCDSGIELLIVDPVSSHGLEEVLATARLRGIVVVCVNGATAGAGVAVVSDNVQAGALAARYLSRRLGGQGDIVIVAGAEVTAVTDRIAGFTAALAEEDGMRVVAMERGDNSRRSGQVAGAAIRSMSGVAGVFAINDPMALGVLDALDAGSFPLLVSVDGSAEATRAIASGGRFVATAAQDPAALAVAALRAGSALVGGTATPGRTLVLPVRLVTGDDLDSYLPWGRE